MKRLGRSNVRPLPELAQIKSGAAFFASICVQGGWHGRCTEEGIIEAKGFFIWASKLALQSRREKEGQQEPRVCPRVVVSSSNNSLN
jgi:hypothetical protein